jgi:catechol 2,3-dioxygenase-like lactoylglutathione lyase family enzyme
MKIKNLDHLNMTVTNLKESETWYKSVFGFEIVEEGVDEGEPWSIIRSGEAMLCMYQRPLQTQSTTGMELKDGPLHINHFAVRITNQDEWLSVIEKEKLELFYGGLVQYPSSKSWYVKDPNGYKIEVVLWNNDKVRF